MNKWLAFTLSLLGVVLLILSAIYVLAYTAPPPALDAILEPPPATLPAPEAAGPFQLAAAPFCASQVTGALDAVSSPDANLRAEALNLLSHCTPADLATIEPYTTHADPAVRQQALFQKERLSGTVFAFEAVYPDGMPGADVKLSFKIHVALTAAERSSVAAAPAQHDPDFYTPVACRGAVVADQHGLAPAGSLAEGDYVGFIDIAGAAPEQHRKEQFHISSLQSVVRIEVLRGCNLRVRVIDEAGLPVTDATVFMAGSDRGMRGLTTSGLLYQVRGSPNDHRSGPDGMVALGRLACRQATIAAAKSGYEPLVEYQVKLKDGEAMELPVTLKAAPPATVTFQLTPAPARTGAYRVLLLEYTRFKDRDIAHRNNLTHDAESIRQLIGDGAVDAGVNDANGQVQAVLAPDDYFVYLVPVAGGEIHISPFELRTPPMVAVAIPVEPAGR